jgi:hypothetical protein
MGRLWGRLSQFAWEVVGGALFVLLLIVRPLLVLGAYLLLSLMLVVGCALDTKVIGTWKCVRRVTREVVGSGRPSGCEAR